MHRSRLLALITCLTTLALATVSPAQRDGWTSLFDGKTLRGWTQRNGTAKYKVRNRTIVGTTVKGSPNSFLCSDKFYGDFELEFDELHEGIDFGVLWGVPVANGFPLCCLIVLLLVG